MIASNPNRMRRCAPAFLALALLAGACGTDGSGATADDEPLVSDAATTSAPPTTSTTPPTTTEPPEPDTTEPTGTDAALPPALPIAQSFEIANPVFAAVAGPDHFLVGGGATLSVISEEGLTEVPLTGGLLQFDPFYLSTTDTHAVVHGFEYGWGPEGGGLNAAVAIELDTLQLVSRAEPPGTTLATFPQTGDGATILGRVDDQRGRFDLGTLELEPRDRLASAIADAQREVRLADDELWLLAGDGTIEVLDAASGELVRTGDAERQIGDGFGRWMGHDDERIWFSSALDNAVALVDRSTAEVTKWIDVAAAYPDDSVEIVASTGNFLLIDLSGPTGEWYVLAELDLESGGIVAHHVVASSTRDLWPTALDRPHFGLVGDDLYVVDHLRRVVRVDRARWGDQSGAAWEDPGLPITREFDGEAAVVASIAVDWFEGRGGDLPRTDPELSEAAGSGVSGWNPGQSSAFTVDIHDDRAWVGVTSPGIGPAPALALERDGEGGWLINSVSECWLIRLAFFVECPAHE